MPVITVLRTLCFFTNFEEKKKKKKKKEKNDRKDKTLSVQQPARGHLGCGGRSPCVT